MECDRFFLEPFKGGQRLEDSKKATHNTRLQHFKDISYKYKGVQSM